MNATVKETLFLAVVSVFSIAFLAMKTYAFREINFETFGNESNRFDVDDFLLLK